MAYVTTPIPTAANTARVLLTTGAIEESWWVGDGAKEEDAVSARAHTRDVNFAWRMFSSWKDRPNDPFDGTFA
jgi:hypothetical protein